MMFNLGYNDKVSMTYYLRFAREGVKRNFAILYTCPSLQIVRLPIYNFVPKNGRVYVIQNGKWGLAVGFMRAVSALSLAAADKNSNWSVGSASARQ